MSAISRRSVMPLGDTSVASGRKDSNAAPELHVQRWSGTCVAAGGEVIALDVVAIGRHIALCVNGRQPVWLDRATGDLLASNVLKAVTYALGGKTA